MRPLNEVFKNKIKVHFEKFAIVKTEVEILRLPRRMDLLVIEADTPIKEHVSLFQYFKKFNIIEFKSEADELNLYGYLKMGYYLHAFLLREEGAFPKNTTLTLVSTFKPKIPVDRISWMEIRKGLYLVKGLGIVDLHIVVIDELSRRNTEEYNWLKTFVSKKNRKNVIIEAFIKGSEEDREELLLLYKEEIEQILKELGIDMISALKKEAYKIAKEFGIDAEYKKLIQIEKYRVKKAEVEKQKAEAEKQKAEVEKQKAEVEKQKAEVEKQKAEVEKQKAEVEKQKAEVEKQKAERKTKKETRKVKLRTAIAMKKKGLSLDTISEIIELDKGFLERLFTKRKITIVTKQE
jgi:hypothetical protein